MFPCSVRSHCASQPHMLPQDASTPRDRPAAGQPLKGRPSSQSVESTCPEDGHTLVERGPAAASDGCSRAVQVEKASAGTAPSSADTGELDPCCNTTLSALPGGDAQLAKHRNAWTFQTLDLGMKHAFLPQQETFQHLLCLAGCCPGQVKPVMRPFLRNCCLMNPLGGKALYLLVPQVFPMPVPVQHSPMQPAPALAPSPVQFSTTPLQPPQQPL